MLALRLSSILIRNTIFIINICCLIQEGSAPPPMAKHRIVLAGSDVGSLDLWPGSPRRIERRALPASHAVFEKADAELRNPRK
jgi:hypothetical protein